MSQVLISGVDKRYGRQPVLTGIDLTVPHGSITAVLGASGCGKTTLLRLVAGFTEVDAGSISIGGTAARVALAPSRLLRESGSKQLSSKRGLPTFAATESSIGAALGLASSSKVWASAKET